MTKSVASESLYSYLVQDFVNGDCGRVYGVTPREKARLVEEFRRNTREIRSGTSALSHTVLAREILAIPPEVAGDVIECGVWKGASSASLSKVCLMVGRRLMVCDSYQGLPDEGLQLHIGLHFGNYGYYKQGMFCGTLEEVRENIKRFGAIEVCEFVVGFFSDSLQKLRSPIAFAFLDVDLASSTLDCLRYIWPLLAEGEKVYTDDAGDLDVVRVFFDQDWWRSNLDVPAPGYVGSGCGLPLSADFSSLGYTRKITQFRPDMWRRSDHLYYPGDDAGPKRGVVFADGRDV